MGQNFQGSSVKKKKTTWDIMNYVSTAHEH